jgi:hypothetical protein
MNADQHPIANLTLITRGLKRFPLFVHRQSSAVQSNLPSILRPFQAPN